MAYKVIVFIFALQLLQASSSLYSMPSLTSEFISGFEQGIYIRNSNNRLEEDFGCSLPRNQYSKFAFIHDLFEDITEISEKLSSSPSQIATNKTIMNMIEVYINHFSVIAATLTDSEFEGDAFCRGLIFGHIGERILTSIALTLVEFKGMFKSYSLGTGASLIGAEKISQ